MSIFQTIRQAAQPSLIEELGGPEGVLGIVKGLLALVEGNESGVEDAIRTSPFFAEGFAQIEAQIKEENSKLVDMPDLDNLEGGDKEEWESLDLDAQTLARARVQQDVDEIKEIITLLENTREEVESSIQIILKGVDTVKSIFGTVLGNMVVLRAKACRKLVDALKEQGFSDSESFQIMMQSNSKLVQDIKELLDRS